MKRTIIFTLLLLVIVNTVFARYPYKKSFMLSKRYAKEAPQIGGPYPLASSLEMTERPKQPYPYDQKWHKGKLKLFAMKRIYRLALGIRDSQGLEFRGLPQEEQIHELLRGGELVFEFEYRQIGPRTKANVVVWFEYVKGSVGRSQIGMVHPKLSGKSRGPRGVNLVSKRWVTDEDIPKSELAPWQR